MKLTPKALRRGVRRTRLRRTPLRRTSLSRALRALGRALAHNDRGPRASERGMSLVEVMVVVVIMGLVASVVGVAVFNALGKAQRDTAKNQISQLADALDMYKLNYRKYPSTGEGLQSLAQSRGGTPPVMESVPKDPWGNDYVYIFPGQRNTNSFDLMSYGADGAQGGGDDVGNWEEAAVPQ
jgi:general secretion pathway protein G